MQRPTATFPNVVGCDLHRAKAMIASKLPYNRLRFVVVESVPGKKTPITSSADNEIVLMYNPKDNSVWQTPKFYGVVKTESDVRKPDEGYLSFSEDELNEDSE